MFALMGDFFAILVGVDFFAEALVRGDILSEAADDRATEVPMWCASPDGGVPATLELNTFKNVLFEACILKKAPMAVTHAALFEPDFGGKKITFFICTDEVQS